LKRTKDEHNKSKSVRTLDLDHLQTGVTMTKAPFKFITVLKLRKESTKALLIG
jgi:hypothetical protein